MHRRCTEIHAAAAADGACASLLVYGLHCPVNTGESQRCLRLQAMPKQLRGAQGRTHKAKVGLSMF